MSKRESMDLHSSSIIEDRVRRKLKNHRLIYSDEESISDIDDKPLYRKSESDETSDGMSLIYNIIIFQISIKKL